MMETAVHTNGTVQPAAVPVNGVVVTNPPLTKLPKNQRRKLNAQNKNLEKFGGQVLPINRKRPNSDNHTTGSSNPTKKAKNGLSEPKPPQTKNPVATLNELRKNLIYKIESQAGPVHAPIFRISVVVDGQKYIGQGRSKKIARSEAAAAALRSFIQFKDGATLTPIKPTTNVDFTSDDHLENGINVNNDHDYKNADGDDLVNSIQRSLEVFKNDNKSAWVKKLQSKYFILSTIFYFMLQRKKKQIE